MWWKGEKKEESVVEGREEGGEFGVRGRRVWCEGERHGGSRGGKRTDRKEGREDVTCHGDCLELDSS